MKDLVIILRSIVTREIKNWIEDIEIKEILLEMRYLIYKGD